MKVRIEPEASPMNFDDSDEAENLAEKKFREFERGEQERIKIELRK